MKRLMLFLLLGTSGLYATGQDPTPSAHPNRSAARAKVRVAIAKDLPHLDGGRLKASLVEVAYPAGGSSPAHSHPCPVVVYVISGAVRMQVEGEPERIYNAGQTFYEGPNRAHLVSANASKTRPARFLAYFICDNDDPLSGPPSKGGTQ